MSRSLSRASLVLAIGGAVKNSNCAGNIDMTSDGTFAGLEDWGLAVATTDANSIKNTSVLSPYIVNGACN
jgi:hypothetical protein